MFLRKKAENGVVYECSDRLGAPHLFSTRLGGVSTDAHLASMNLGENRGDSPENVRTNFDLLTAVIGKSFSDTVRGGQVHSTNIRTVSRFDRGNFFESTDGFVTASEGVVLTVKIADCLPLLLFDPENRVIAAVHAGWRGSAAGISAKGIEKMRELGADPAVIRAAIGACIHSCCFEVREDFADSVISMCGSELAHKVISYRNGRMFADIVKLNTGMLLGCGILPDNIDVNPVCTCCESNIYFSHRATGGHRGTMAAVITL